MKHPFFIREEKSRQFHRKVVSCLWMTHLGKILITLSHMVFSIYNREFYFLDRTMLPQITLSKQI